MMKSVLCTALLALSVKTQAAPVAGDVAFVTFNADDNTFSLVTFTDLAPNTRIFLLIKNGMA